jgi:hypothetical protein
MESKYQSSTTSSNNQSNRFNKLSASPTTTKILYNLKYFNELLKHEEKFDSNFNHNNKNKFKLRCFFLKNQFLNKYLIPKYFEFNNKQQKQQQQENILNSNNTYKIINIKKIIGQMRVKCELDKLLVDLTSPNQLLLANKSFIFTQIDSTINLMHSTNIGNFLF